MPSDVPAHEPPADCSLCPRLVAYRRDLETAHPHYRNRPVPAFGPTDCRLLIVGLAPGKSGANRTGRPFTGDYAGDLLYATLAKFGFSAGLYAESAEDGLTLLGTRITNAVRCVPPDNRPTTEEIVTCRHYLRQEIKILEDTRVVVALGRISHAQFISTLGLKQNSFPFSHGAEHRLSTDLNLLDSYHCSRYNTNTGRLTPTMFESVFGRARTLVDQM